MESGVFDSGVIRNRLSENVIKSQNLNSKIDFEYAASDFDF